MSHFNVGSIDGDCRKFWKVSKQVRRLVCCSRRIGAFVNLYSGQNVETSQESIINVDHIKVDNPELGSCGS